MERRVLENNGFATLISVLVLGAITTTIVLSLLLLGTDYTKTVIDDMDFSRAKYVADACAEDALQNIRDNVSYSGTSTLNIGYGSCTSNVTNNGGGNRRIIAQGIVGSSTRKVLIYTDQVNPYINVTSWKEVPNF